MIPFEFNTDTWAIIAGMDLVPDQIIDEAKYALNEGEIDFTDYCKILNHLKK